MTPSVTTPAQRFIQEWMDCLAGAADADLAGVDMDGLREALDHIATEASSVALRAEAATEAGDLLLDLGETRWQSLATTLQEDEAFVAVMQRMGWAFEVVRRVDLAPNELLMLRVQAIVELAGAMEEAVRDRLAQIAGAARKRDRRRTHAWMADPHLADDERTPDPSELAHAIEAGQRMARRLRDAMKPEWRPIVASFLAASTNGAELAETHDVSQATVSRALKHFKSLAKGALEDVAPAAVPHFVRELVQTLHQAPQEPPS